MASMKITGKARRMITAGTNRSSALTAPLCAFCWRGVCMLSRAGRKRRSSAYTAMATTASTVISTSVSKPRKSTRITLTTLVPPPRG